MYNVSTEQIIKVKAPKNSIIFKAVMIIACILAATTIPATNAFGIILFAVLVVFTVFVFRYYNAEYEYSFVDGEMTVDRIMARTRRRRCGVYDISKAELVAQVGSQDALRLEHRQLRTHDYTSNEGNESCVVIYTFNSNNELERIYIEPSEEMLNAFMECVSKQAYKVPDDFKPYTRRTENKK